jgi:hypothetical protein
VARQAQICLIYAGLNNVDFVLQLRKSSGAVKGKRGKHNLRLSAAPKREAGRNRARPAAFHRRQLETDDGERDAAQFE